MKVVLELTDQEAEKLIDVLDGYWDAGPIGAGWQSDLLGEVAGKVKTAVEAVMNDDTMMYCCEKFQEAASGDDPPMEPQSDGKAWLISGDEIIALTGVIYCPFCGKKLPVSNC